MKKKVADIIMDTLADNGVEQAFCVVGGGAMYLDNALGITKRIKTIFNHHEQACAMAAEGYARVKDKLALVCVTSGPGGTNTLTGVMGAYQDSIPMIVISGQVRYETTVKQSGLNLRRRGEQEFDIIDSVQNMTKYAKMIINPKDIKMEVQKAYDIAMSGRRGPVWLDIPLDVQRAMIEESELTPCDATPEVVKCSDKEFEFVIESLKNAKSPCVLLGSAIASTHSQDTIKKAFNNWKIPAVSACVVTNVATFDDDFYFGTTGGIGTRCGNFIINNSDLLLVLGCSLGYKQTTFTQNAFAPNSKIIMVDIEEDESKKEGLNIDTYIKCDVKYFIEKMILSKKVSAPQDWIEHCNMLKNRFNLFENASENEEERVNAYNFWKEYYYKEPDKNITVLGNSSGLGGKLQNGCKKNAQRTVANLNCGSMGYDIPASIGACVAAKSPIVLVTGDGSFMMNLQELQTIVSNGLPIKIVVLSNDGYRGIEQTCKNYFNGQNVGCTCESGLFMPDFEKISNAFGIEYKRCNKHSEVSASIDWIFNKKEACLLEVVQKYDNPASPVLKAKLNPDGTSAKLEYDCMYPFLTEKETIECKFIKN